MLGIWALKQSLKKASRKSSQKNEQNDYNKGNPPNIKGYPFAEVRVREFAMPSEDWMSVSVLRPEVCRVSGQKCIKHWMIHFAIGR